MLGTYRDYPAPVSTYTLRSANPAKTRCDAVVVGVVQDGKGSRRAERRAGRRGRRQGLRPQASARCSRRSASPARPARSPRCRPASGCRRRCSCSSGSARSARARRRRQSPYAAPPAPPPRAVTNTASVALALPAESPELVRAVTEGYLLGGYTYTAYKKRPTTSRRRCPARSSCSARRRGRRSSARPSTRRRSSPEAVADDARLGEHPARGLHAAGLRRRRSRPP